LRRKKKIEKEASIIKNDAKRVKTGEDHVDDRGWELDRDEEGQLTMVRVHMSHNAVPAVDQSQSQSMWLKSQINELSALQMIATQNYSSSSQMASQAAHVVGTSIIARDEENGKIYTILPYHRDGTLLQFCQSMGNLEESLARFIFRQIVQVRNKILIGESSPIVRFLILILTITNLLTVA
jgi:serine/threonine protein kinase